MISILWADSSATGMTIIDKKNRKISFDRSYHRIISLYGAHTENLFHLGCSDQIIGVSTNDTYPEQIRDKKRYSYHDDPEKFMAARPDLILIRPMIDNGYSTLIKQLEKMGITVVSLQPKTIEEMYEYWTKLGLLTGSKTTAEKMISDFKNRTQNIRELTKHISPKKKVYFEAIHSRMKTFTPGAMPIFALETAGGQNIATDAKSSRNTNIAIYGKEQILSKAGEIDVFLAQKGVMNPISIAQIKNEPGFNIIKAVKTNQVYLIDEKIIARPVPRLYAGILTIGKLLYPDIFERHRRKEKNK